jgi:hypothetical protein
MQASGFENKNLLLKATRKKVKYPCSLYIYYIIYIDNYSLVHKVKASYNNDHHTFCATIITTNWGFKSSVNKLTGSGSLPIEKKLESFQLLIVTFYFKFNDL